MPNFPGSLDTFTTKVPHVSSNAAADVNALQDAVVAIETTLKTTPNPNPLDYVSKTQPDIVTGVKSAADIRQWGNGVYHVESALNPNGAAIPNGADAVASIQAAINAAQTFGRGRVVLAGPYNLTATTSAGGLTWHLAIASDKITIEWLSGALLTSTVNAGIFFISGSSKTAGTANWATNRYVDATVYPMNGPVAKGAKTVTTMIASDAGNFAAGDWIFIRTGEVLALYPANEPDSELNQVVSAVAGTGVITLRWPTAKPYAQEYWQTGPIGPTDTVNHAAGSAPFGVAKVTDRTLQQIRLINPRVSSSATSTSVIFGDNIYDFRGEGGAADVATGFESFSNRRSVVWEKTIVRCSADTLYHFTAATGTTDMVLDDVTLAVSGGVGQIHIHEGSAQVSVHGGRILNAGSAVAQNCISIRARAYDIKIDGPYILNGSTNASPMIYVDSNCGGSGMGGSIKNVITAGTGSATSGGINVVPTTGWSVGPNTHTSGLEELVPLGNAWDQAEIVIPAAELTLAGGAPVRVVVGNWPGWDLRHGFVDSVSGWYRVPRNWKKYQVILLWINDGAGAGNVVWNVYSMDPILGADVSTLNMNTGMTATALAQNLLTSSTTPVSATNVGAEGSNIYVSRTGTSGSDTLLNVVALLGIMLRRTA